MLIRKHKKIGDVKIPGSLELLAFKTILYEQSSAVFWVGQLPSFCVNSVLRKSIQEIIINDALNYSNALHTRFNAREGYEVNIWSHRRNYPLGKIYICYVQTLQVFRKGNGKGKCGF